MPPRLPLGWSTRQHLDVVEEGWSAKELQAACRDADVGSVGRFAAALASYLDVPDPDRVWFVPSARVGLEVLLRATDPIRPEVLVPAFTCEAVASAVTAAGRQVRPTDLHPVPGHLDVDAVVDQLTDRVGAVVVTHTFGVPVDLRRLLGPCRERGVVVIEDCAHAVGARIGGRAAGSFADAALLSFNRFKPVTLGSGGAVLLHTPGVFHADPREELARFAAAPPVAGAQEREQLERFAARMRRHRRRFPAEDQALTRLLRTARARAKSRAPARGGGSGPRTADAAVPVQPVGAVHAELGRRVLARQDARLAIARANAEAIAARVHHPCWPVAPDTEPAWLHQKVGLPSIAARQALVDELNRRGIRAGNRLWPQLIGAAAVDGGGGVDPFPFARELAERWVEIPVHRRVDARALDTIVAVLNRVPPG